MAITDNSVLSEVQQLLIESVDGGLTISSALWTVAEVINYLNQRQYDLLKETGIVLKKAPVVTTPNVLRQPLPTDWIITRGVLWQRQNNTWTVLARADGMQLDLYQPDWQYNDVQNGPASNPLAYTDGELQTLTIQVMPAVDAPGVIELIYVALSAVLSNTGINLTVPDEFEPAIRWGTIADMLMKLGRGQSLERAQYAESRYQEGIAAAHMMLGGFS